MHSCPETKITSAHTPPLPGRVERALLFLILALAFLLRLGWPTLSEFKRDEATIVRLALSIAHRGYLPVTGVASSTGVDNLPLTLYLMAIPLRLWSDPLAAVLFTGLLNGMAVLACYVLGRCYFGQVAALISSYLFAVSSWAVLYGRKIWAQNLPLVTLCFVAFLYATFVREKRWALVGAFVSLSALVGLHLEGLAAIPVLGFALLLYRKQVAPRPFLLGLFLCVLLISPYLIHDALQGWKNAQRFAHYAGGEAHFSWDALRYAFFMMGNEEVAGRMGGALYAEYLAGLPNLWWLNRLMEGLLAAALLYGVFRIIWGPPERRRPFTLLLIWFATPIALLMRPTASVHPFYLNILYPVQFLLIAILLADGFSLFATLPPAQKRWALPAVAGMSLFLITWGAWQILSTGRVFAFMAEHPTTGGYGIPLRYTRDAAKHARQLAQGAEILVLSEETKPTMHETPAVFDALLFQETRRFADGRFALPVPDSRDAVYLVGPIKGETSDLIPVMTRLEEMACVQSGPVIPLPDGWSYRLFRRSCPDREDVLTSMVRFPQAIPFANSVSYLAYDVREEIRAGETLELWLAWWVQAPPPTNTSYHFFAHLVDSAEHLVSQYDGAGFPTEFWKPGDLVLTRFPIPIPADLPEGEYQIWSGMYTYPDIRGVSFLDEAGNPAGERVLVGRIRVTRGD